MEFKHFKQIFNGILMLLKCGLAIGIIVIVEVHLYNVYVSYYTNNWYSIYATCAIKGEAGGTNLCAYTYAVAGFSLLLQIIATFFLFVDCCGGFTKWIDLAIHGVLAAWWTACSIVISDAVKTTNDKGWSQENWRNAVVVMSWVAALLSYFIAFICLIDSLKCLAGCCRNMTKKHEQEKEAKQHHDQPGNQEMNRDEAQKAVAV